jgi:hypothetical protein
LQYRCEKLVHKVEEAMVLRLAMQAPETIVSHPVYLYAAGCEQSNEPSALITPSGDPRAGQG